MLQDHDIIYREERQFSKLPIFWGRAVPGQGLRCVVLPEGGTSPICLCLFGASRGTMG